MKRRAIVLATLICLATFNAAAQQNQGQQPPPTQPPQPAPQPAPRQPTPTPTPQPSPTQNQPLRIRGRIIADAHTTFPQLEVRIETDGGQPIGFAYTNSDGEFNYQGNGSFGFEQNIYVVVNLEGFKPYRERLNGIFGIGGFDGIVTIFLERENTIKVPGRNGSAVVDLKQLRAKIPGKAVDEYEKALKESTKGNYAKAVDGLQRAIKLAPDFYEAQHSLGIQYLAMQRYEDAENPLLKARDLSPKAAEPLINLGTLYYQRGESQADAGQKEKALADFQKAAELLDQSINRDPLSPSAHLYLGAALYKTGSYERAESVLKRGLELNPNLNDARLTLINVYTKQARLDEALEQVNLFLEKNPKAPQRPSLENIKKQIENVLAQGKK